MVKVVGLNGSLRSGSHSYQALRQALQRVEALGAEAELLDLRSLTLPFCDGGDDYDDYPDVARLRETVKAADALVLVTPEYHGSLSGVLKNTLDLMSFDQLDGKVTGLMSVLGGQSNSNSLNDMRTIMRWVHAWVIPEQIAIGQAWNAFDGDGTLKDAKLAERLDRFAESLVENAQKLRP